MTTAINSTNKQYTKYLPHWQKLEDCYEGQTHIKSLGREYLPFTDGQKADSAGTTGSKGNQDYETFKFRARFHDITGETIRQALGVISKREVSIDVPDEMDFIKERATRKGDDGPTLFLQMCEQLFLFGRMGLLIDMKEREEGVENNPYFALYSAKSILDWSTDGDRFVVLEEEKRIDDYEETAQTGFDTQKRLLQLEGGRTYTARIIQNNGLVTDAGNGDLITLGNRPFNKIPFVFINSDNLGPDVKVPPLSNLADIDLSIYNSEASLRFGAFLNGLAQLVMKAAIAAGNEPPVIRTDAGAVIFVGKEGDAKWISPQTTGADVLRQLIQDDLREAGAIIGGLRSPEGRQRESGESIRLQQDAQYTRIQTIAKIAAAGLEKALKLLAEWMELSPEKIDQIKVTIDLDDLNRILTADELQKWTALAVDPNSPVTIRDVVTLMNNANFTEDDLEKLYEQKIKEAEQLRKIREATGENQNPNQPEQPETPEGDNPSNPEQDDNATQGNG